MCIIYMLVTLHAIIAISANPRHRSNEERQKENECFAQEKIFHRATNECYKLLTKGPCQKGEWFVLNKPSDSSNDNRIKIEGTCVREKCSEGEYYWSQTRSCVQRGDESRLCGSPTNEELTYNLFGEGECSCTKEPPRGRLHNDREKPCHILYMKGPCRSGEVLGFRDAEADEPTCIPDPCFYETIYRRSSRTLSSDSVLAPWKNNTCYELGTQGPCGEGLTFKVHSRYLRPTCVTLTNTIFNLGNGCFADEMGLCQMEVDSGGEKYKRGIISFLRTSRRRRDSHRRRGLKRNFSAEKYIWDRR